MVSRLRPQRRIRAQQRDLQARQAATAAALAALPPITDEEGLMAGAVAAELETITAHLRPLPPSYGTAADD